VLRTSLSHNSHFYFSVIPYLLECNAHLFWPNYVTKIRVHIRFDGALDSIANLNSVFCKIEFKSCVFCAFFLISV
jgi:hypothetical protein